MVKKWYKPTLPSSVKLSLDSWNFLESLGLLQDERKENLSAWCIHQKTVIRFNSSIHRFNR